MQTSWRAGIITLAIVAAIPWLGLDRNGSARSAHASAVDCNFPDPLTHCAAEAYFGYPIGDGLVVTLIEELF